MHDVAIVGGGPGGLYAALHLARRGVDVVVFEEHEIPGRPVHCTGVLADEAFAEFDLPRSSVLNPLRTVVFTGPSGATIDYTTASAEAVVIDRSAFDQALAEQAQLAGAQLLVGRRVLDVAPSGSRVTLTLATGESAHARAAILACGANYAIQRRLGFGMPALHLQSAQRELAADTSGPVEVHFGHDVAPRGFAWAVPVQRPHGAFVRVGLMCDGNARDRFSRFIAAVGPRWGIAAHEMTTAAPRTKILPLGPVARTYGPRVLAVGDAAGLVKATTGGGIYYSLLSARMAADVLTDALRTDQLDAPTLASYEYSWRQALGDEIDAQMELRRLSHHMSDADIDALFELARTDGVMPIVRRTAQFNRHRHLILSLLNHPPARRLLMRHVLGWGRIA